MARRKLRAPLSPVERRGRAQRGLAERGMLIAAGGGRLAQLDHPVRGVVERDRSVMHPLGRGLPLRLQLCELDPDGDPAAVAFRVRIALRIVERIESTCGWTDTVRAGFRDSACTGPLGDQRRDWFHEQG